MGLSYSTDLIHWTEATDGRRCCPRPAENLSSTCDASPVLHRSLTPGGIVLIYNGADDKLVYRTASRSSTARDPRKLISRSDQPIFAPEKEWERVGQVPNVIIREGMLRRAGGGSFYYGEQTQYIGVAEAPSK